MTRKVYILIYFQKNSQWKFEIIFLFFKHEKICPKFQSEAADDYNEKKNQKNNTTFSQQKKLKIDFKTEQFQS